MENNQVSEVVRSWFTEHGFSFDSKEFGFRKNKLFIPVQMAEDLMCEEQWKKFDWVATNNFAFMVSPDRKKLILTNLFVGVSLQDFIPMSYEELTTHVQNLKNKHLN